MMTPSPDALDRRRADLTEMQMKALEPLRNGPMRVDAYLDMVEPANLAALPWQVGDGKWLLITSNIPRLVMLTPAGRKALQEAAE